MTIFTELGQDLTHLPHKENMQSDIFLWDRRIILIAKNSSYSYFFIIFFREECQFLKLKILKNYTKIKDSTYVSIQCGILNRRIRAGSGPKFWLEILDPDPDTERHWNVYNTASATIKKMKQGEIFG